jgi:hypothetical protein
VSTLRGSPGQHDAPARQRQGIAKSENDQATQAETFSRQHTTDDRARRFLPEIAAGGSPPPRVLPDGETFLAPRSARFTRRAGTYVGERAARRIQARRARKGAA